MGTTPILAIPYIEPGDLVTTYPTQDKAQAERLEAFLAPVFGNYARTVNQPIATGTATTVIGSQVAAEGGITLNVATGEVTIPAPGLYLLTGWAAFVPNAAGYRYSWWVRNGGRVANAHWPTSTITSSEFSVPLTALARCAAGDKISYQVQQSSGVSLDLVGTVQLTGYQVARIAP
jgi:hypothetical protein